MPRQSRLDYPGALHHVIGRGIERRFIFKDDSQKTEFYRRLSENLSRYDVQCFAWCVMGNHFHLLLQSGKTSLPEFMRGLLTGYAVYFNRKNKRAGHLFQNRYRSILCDKDEYLLPLIRYIHLNPVKANMIEYAHLGGYSWTGHREICRFEKGIINKEEVLGYFGRKRGEAIAQYKKFIQDGLNINEDFEGGGLKRSVGGLANLLRRGKDEREMFDERILGSGDFVEEVYEAANVDDEEAHRIKSKKDLLEKLCKHYRMDLHDIIRSRTRPVREARQMYIYLANRYLGESLVSLGRELGIGRSAACMAYKKLEGPDKEGLVKQIMN